MSKTLVTIINGSTCVFEEMVLTEDASAFANYFTNLKSESLDGFWAFLICDEKESKTLPPLRYLEEDPENKIMAVSKGLIFDPKTIITIGGGG